MWCTAAPITTTPLATVAFGSTTRGIGVQWPGAPHSVSDRDAQASLLADIADDLPFIWSA